MNLKISKDNLRFALENKGVFDDYTEEAADWIFDYYVDDYGDYDFEDLCDLIRYNAHCYWPGRNDYRMDVYNYYEDYIELEEYYTLEEFLKILDPSNHMNNDRYWIEANLDSYLMKDGSIIRFE